MFRTALRTGAPCLALLLLVVSAAGTARADGSQLCRSMANLTLAPFDIALSPVITAKDMYYGLSEVGDEVLIQIAAAAPGYVYLNTIQVGGGVIRIIAGIYEFFPGWFTLFREGSSPPLYRSQDETWQIYSTDVGPCPIRFGSSYNTINEG